MHLRLALLALGLLAGAAHARDAVVDGVVFEERDGKPGRSGDEPGVADVIVSNGQRLVRTDAQGHYRLPVREGQTVFVIKPGDRSFVPNADGLPGFWRHYAPKGSPKRKYQGIAATGTSTRNWDFALTPRQDPGGNGFQMLVFADSQTATLADVDYYRRDIVAPIVGKQLARLGTTLGDIVSDDLSLYPALNRVTAQLGVPWFHVPGNHDLNFDAGDDLHSLESWRAVYGPDTYAVEEANASFVFLDDVIYTPGARPAYVGGLREDQFAFLQAYLAQLPRERLVVLGMHIPLFDAAPDQETFRHTDRRRLFALLKDFPHVLVLSGHSHTQRQVMHGADEGWTGVRPLHEYNVGAACGAFWSGAKDADGIPDATMSDGTPNGYAVLKVAPGGDYTLAYHAARAADDAQLLLHAPKVLRQGAYPAWGIYANVFMGQDDTAVDMRIDDGLWQPMKRQERADPRVLAENARDDAADALRGYDRSPEATPSTHLWRAALPTTLEVGEHTVEVRARLPTGEYSARTVYRLQRAEP
ncbi:calcineurin-like phosphoesterase family protein [Xanthomonas sp. NCPPB 1067]|uniref:calcineurin-like phosphoesterase C-terminal domain-containing protein n=1 Tax=Xanthomonas sp. NCPPB 1067 TaxID=487524 RepID=UPI001E63467D|nr:calcineurin-like phosphoesterase family protein [Xanthomonas sp. NCPPB 1067]MCC4589116.1 calcineurin-like phosphoesterase family protein [Xanthomonas sp. NCPPB 1067]